MRAEFEESSAREPCEEKRPAYLPPATQQEEQSLATSPPPQAQSNPLARNVETKQIIFLPPLLRAARKLSTFHRTPSHRVLP